MAYDQDSLNTTLIYDIISGNDRNLFWINPNNGIIYLMEVEPISCDKIINLEITSIQIIRIGNRSGGRNIARKFICIAN